MSDSPGGEASLYQKEPKIYPREVSGRFDRLRKIAVFVLLGGAVAATVAAGQGSRRVKVAVRVVASGKGPRAVTVSRVVSVMVMDRPGEA